MSLTEDSVPSVPLCFVTETIPWFPGLTNTNFRLPNSHPKTTLCDLCGSARKTDSARETDSRKDAKTQRYEKIGRVSPKAPCPLCLCVSLLTQFPGPWPYEHQLPSSKLSPKNNPLRSLRVCEKKNAALSKKRGDSSSRRPESKDGSARINFVEKLLAGVGIGLDRLLAFVPVGRADLSVLFEVLKRIHDA